MKNLKTYICVWLFVLLSLELHAGGFAFVGPSSDGNCDFDSIQTAMDSGMTFLLISNAMQYNENLVLPSTNEDVTIQGGYANCTLSSFDLTTRSTVSGHLAEEPVLIITASSEGKFISIRNMNLVNGTGAGFIPAGGINMVASNDSLSLNHTTVALNEGFIGGGIYIGTPTPASGESPTLALSNNALIINNRSTSETLGGGGVFCENGRIVMRSNASIKRNTTDGSGGGIYTFGCQLLEWSGSVSDDEAEKGIYDNTAKIHGGGIFAINASDIQLGTAGGSSDLYGSVNNNRADSDNDGVGDGGGIYAASDEVRVFLLGSVIKDNRSGANGGAIYAQENASVFIERQNDQCWVPYKCNHISNNLTSTNDGNGGGLYVTSGASATISSAYFESNRADNGTGIYANGVDTDVVLSNATFFNNGNDGGEGYNDSNVVMSIDNANIDAVHNTFFNNNETVSTFRVQDEATLTIQASIIHTDTAFSVLTRLNAVPVMVNCVNTNRLPLDGTSIFDWPITYVDESIGDLRLAGQDTGAIDTCPENTVLIDIEGDARPYDRLDLPNFAGPNDVGADEYSVQIIYKNGFESESE